MAVYHFTPEQTFKTFTKGDIGFHFGTQEQAAQRGKDLKAESGRVFRAYLNIRNPYRVRLDLNAWWPSHIGLYLYSEGVITDAQWNEIQSLDGHGYDTPGAKRLREMLDNIGIDGFAYPNGVEGDGESYIALRDDQIVRTDVLPVSDNKSASVKPELLPETDSDGRELTEAQQKFFSGSKAVDNEGRLLVLYHGTGSKFTVFDKSRIAQNFGDRGGDLGFYFSPYPEDARDYARNATGYTGKGEIMEVYLNLQNPLVIEDEGWGTAIGQADARHGDLKRWAEDGGYDGIIVRSTDIEMDDSGTPDTVYVAFSPEQIKNVTNINPSDNPDVRYSLAGDTADGLDLSQTRRRLVNRTMNHAAKELRGLINADTRAAREVQQNQLAALGRDILQKGSVPQSQVIDAFETIWAAGRQVDTTARDDAQNIRDYLRQTGVSLAAQYRADVNGGDWNGFRRKNFGRLKITTEGLPVDVAYAELSGQRPDLFPADIANPADQIQRMAEVAEKLRPQERDMDALYGSAAKGQIEAAFIDMVEQMQQAFNPRERTFTPPAEWGDAEAEEADALWRLDVEADGQPVQDTMEGFQQPVQPRPAPVRLDSRAMGQEDLAQQVRQTTAKYGQEGRLTPRDPDEAYHLDWVELMRREGDENQAQLEQRRTRWKGEAQKMQAAGASREEILMRTGWI